MVFTEGSATEPSYIDAIKHLQTEFAVRVDDRHGTPSQLVPLAIAEHGRLIRASHDEGTPESEAPMVWCMFGRDQHENVDVLIGQATRSGVRVAFSHPCVELWLLLHFAWHGRQQDGSCRRVTDEVRRHIDRYEQRGKRLRLDDVTGLYDQARAHAKRLDQQHDRDGLIIPSQRDPATNVWELVEELGITY